MWRGSGGEDVRAGVERRGRGEQEWRGERGEERGERGERGAVRRGGGSPSEERRGGDMRVRGGVGLCSLSLQALSSNAVLRAHVRVRVRSRECACVRACVRSLARMCVRACAIACSCARARVYAGVRVREGRARLTCVNVRLRVRAHWRRARALAHAAGGA